MGVGRKSEKENSYRTEHEYLDGTITSLTDLTPIFQQKIFRADLAPLYT